MKINFDNLTRKQAFWLFVVSMLIGPFVIWPWMDRHDPVTNLAVIFIGLIVACLAVGVARRAEKMARRAEKRFLASRARLTRLIGTEDGQALYAQLPEAIKMKIDKVIAAKDREH